MQILSFRRIDQRMSTKYLQWNYLYARSKLHEVKVYTIYTIISMLNPPKARDHRVLSYSKIWWRWLILTNFDASSIRRLILSDLREVQIDWGKQKNYFEYLIVKSCSDMLTFIIYSMECSATHTYTLTKHNNNPNHKL